MFTPAEICSKFCSKKGCLICVLLDPKEFVVLLPNTKRKQFEALELEEFNFSALFPLDDLYQWFNDYEQQSLYHLHFACYRQDGFTAVPPTKIKTATEKKVYSFIENCTHLFLRLQQII